MDDEVNADRRQFLKTVSTAGVVSFLYSPLALGSQSRTFVPNVPVDSDFGVTWARAVALLAQMAQGLAYSGQTRDTVVRVNPLVLETTLSELTQYATIITSRLKDIDGILSTADRRRAELTDSSAQAKSQREKITANSTAIFQTWDELNGALPKLDEMVRSRAYALNKAEVTFQEAVERSAHDCSFREIIKAVSAIVAVASGVTAAIPALADSWDQLTNGGTGINNLKLISKKLEPVGGDITSISNGYNTIKDFIGSDGKGAMLIISPESLENHVDDALKAIDSVPEASPADKQAFKDAVRDYVSAVQVRNSAILQMDNIAAKIVANQVESSELQRHEEKLHDAAENASPPNAKEVAESLRAINRSYLRQFRDFLWQVDRSVDYFLLRAYAADWNLKTDDVAQTANAVGSIVTAVRNGQLSMPGNPEHFPISGGEKFKIRIALNQLQRQSVSKGSLILSLHPKDHTPISYPRAYAVYASTVKISVDGVPNVSGYLTHLGPSRFRLGDRSERTFRIQVKGTRKFSAQELNLGVDSTNSSFLASENVYLGLSPFSDWLLEFDDSQRNPAFKSAKFVALEFSGLMRTRRSE